MTVLTYCSGLAVCIVASTWATLASAEPRVSQAVHRGPDATSKFEFGDVPTPSSTDAGNAATYRVLAGEPDANGAAVDCLNDGNLPARADDPRANFFFAAGSDGGRLLVDLGKPIAIKQVNTYSWHPTSRGPQVYKLYAAPVDGDVNVERSRRRDPENRGWKLLADVDTRDDDAGNGGQYGVSIADDGEGDLFETRYLLFVINRTDGADAFDNTFFSEIDVVDGGEHPPAVKPVPPKPDVLQLADGYAIEFHVSEVPELKPWVDETLKPVCAEWYPKIVAMLPSEGYEAPKRFKISFRSDMQGVAHCAGTNIECAGRWFTANLDGEAAGAVVHEMVHVVQQYGRRRGNRNPGWLVEGLADYIRWFLYEPEDQRPRVNPDRANYTDSYRTTGAFLDYVMREHDKAVIEKLNAAMREGEYREELWSELTGKSVEDLWAAYVETLRAPAGESK
jgi:hypothetical protein